VKCDVKKGMRGRVLHAFSRSSSRRCSSSGHRKVENRSCVGNEVTPASASHSALSSSLSKMSVPKVGLGVEQRDPREVVRCAYEKARCARQVSPVPPVRVSQAGPNEPSKSVKTCAAGTGRRTVPGHLRDVISCTAAPVIGISGCVGGVTGGETGGCVGSPPQQSRTAREASVGRDIRREKQREMRREKGREEEREMRREKA
jgi:hypothetical protein